MTLDKLEIGKSARITKVGGHGALRQHFLDMGVIPGAEATLVKKAPLGDPLEIQVHGYELTLRIADAARIEIEEISERHNKHEHKLDRSNREHPGLGEEGKYHVKASEDPLPDHTKLTFALVGNQNSGKTTLFNQLTGSNYHVGNFPGVTVDRKSGSIKGYPDTVITDLPGIYSLSPYSSEEIISRDLVLNEKPHAIINIVDATNIERNLYLTMQLMELDRPMVIALNMMDELTGNGGYIDVNAMEAFLGVPVVPISAIKNEGVNELVKHAMHIAKYQERPGRQDFCDSNDHKGAVHRCIHSVGEMISDHALAAQIPIRFAACKLIEGDTLMMDRLKLDNNELETLEHLCIQLEKERGLDRNSAIAEMRFSFIEKICEKTVIKPKESKEKIRSEKIDRILTGKYTAIPFFILIMAAIFFLTFNVFGAFLQGLIESGVDALTGVVDNALTAAGVSDVIHSLVIDGIFNGIGSVISFIPIIAILFIFLSLLEDSGYIARVAFFMDKAMRRLGLSGRSIVSLLIGFGCTVPAVMSARTIPSERDRKMTILLTPFMSCSAKLPVLSFFALALFPQNAGLVVICLYIVGIILGILAAFLYNKTIFKGEPVPFVMELPNYRFPSLRSVARLVWDKTKDFLQRAFTVIFLATIVIWALTNFNFRFQLVTDTQESILALLAGWIAPIFAPIGLNDWRVVTSFISGFLAKESMVSTLEMLFPGGITSIFSQGALISLLLFSLLYTPCVAAIAAIKRELGRLWAIGVVAWQCILAWLISLAAYAIINLF